MVTYFVNLIALTVLGGYFGSFIVCWAYRLNRGISIVTVAHSFCDKCERKLNVFELFPVVGYLIAKGKCKKCDYKIPPTSFVSELVLAILFPLTYVATKDFAMTTVVLASYCFVLFIIIKRKDNEIKLDDENIIKV